MVVGLLGFLVLALFLNVAYYEYRFIKKGKGTNEITEIYGKVLVARRYIKARQEDPVRRVQ